MTDTYAMPEFAENPEPRAAIVILIDQSPSMEGEKIRMAEEGLRLFLNDLREDSLACKRAEVAVMGFANDTVIHSVFATPADTQVPHLRVTGSGTAIAQAVEEALDLLEIRKDTYNRNGVAYYRPWLVMITDGEPTDRTSAFQQICDRVKRNETAHKVVFMGIGVEGANMAKLQAMSTRPAVSLRDVSSFREFFLWLSASMKAVSRSRMDERVALPPINDWGSI